MDSNSEVVAEVAWEGMNWICLAQDKNKWQDTVNTVMNTWVV